MVVVRLYDSYFGSPVGYAGSLENTSIRRHDLMAQQYVKEGVAVAVVMEDNEPIAIWSRHADH